MEIFFVLALFSGVGISACLFVAGYFFFVNNERLIHRTLGFLFLAIALRVGKSVFYYLFPEMSLFGISVGFVGLSLIGPSFLIYTLISHERKSSLKRLDLVHILIPVIGFLGIVSGFISPTIAYVSGTITLFLYLIFCWWITNSNFSNHSNWNYWLASGISMLWGALAYQLVSETILNYAYGAAFAALMAAVLIFKMLRNPSIFQKKSILSIEPELVTRVVSALENDQYYQNPSLTLAQFAAHLHEPVYRISKAVKRHYGRNFPEVINSLRIEEVKKRLAEKEEFSKVEGLAYDVGFNTPSAFYAAFKKETASTPREYQKSLVG